MITSLIYNSKFRIIRTKFSSVRHNYDYRCSLRVKTQINKLTTNYANNTNYLAIMIRVISAIRSANQKINYELRE